MLCQPSLLQGFYRRVWARVTLFPHRESVMGRDVPLSPPRLTDFNRRVLVRIVLLIPAKMRLFIVPICMGLPMLTLRWLLSRPGVAPQM